MKKKSKLLLISIILCSIIAVTPTLAAGTGGGFNPFSGWITNGTALLPKVSTWEIGSSGSRIAKIWSDAIDATTVVVTGITGALDLNGGKLTIDADADTSLTADTDDQIDIEVSGADDFQFTANTFTALSGSSILTNTINETTASSGVTIEGLLLKDSNLTVGSGTAATDYTLTFNGEDTDIVLTNMEDEGYLNIDANLLVNSVGIGTTTSENMEQLDETIVTIFDSGHGYTYTSGNGSSSDDTVDYVIGSQSLKIVTDAIGTQSIVTKTSISPTIDVSNSNLEIVVKVDSLDYFNTSNGQFYVAVSSDNFSSNYKYVSATYSLVKYDPADKWVKLIFPYYSYSSGSTDLTAINAIRLYIRGVSGGALTAHINKIALIDKPKEGIVSITFDDGHDSQYDYGKAKMSEYGYAATSYIIRDREAVANYLTLAEMTELQDIHGWDISGHGETTFDTLTTTAAAEAELLAIKNYLLKNGFEKGADQLAYPGGLMNHNIIEPLMKKYFKSGRLSTSQNMESMPPGNPYLIKSYQVTNVTSVATVEAMIDSTISDKGWLNLVFHRLEPSLADESVEYLVSDFNDIIDYLYTSGVKVRTMSDVMNSFSQNNTAIALSANGANCSAGEIPLGVDTTGAVEGCYEPTEADITDLDHTATAITDGLIVEADLDEDSGTPTDEDVLTYDSTGSNFNWVAQSTLAAGTASSLAANGANCSAGSYPLGVDASGAVESCTDASAEYDTEGEIETLWGSVNILLETEIDASSELLAIMDDETGTGSLVFGTSPTLTTSIQAASGFSIDISGTGNSYLEIIQDNNAGYLAVGRTTATESSMISITDGGADNKPGFLQLYSDAGSPMYWWTATDNTFRGATSLPADDDAGGYAIMDLDNGTIGASTQAVNGSTFTGTTFTDGTASLTGGSLTGVKLGSLTTNGFVKTGSGDGTLSIATTVAAGEYAAASIDGDDINSNIAGRSLTLTSASPDTLDIDAEIYTDTKCIYIENPTADSDRQSIWRNSTASDYTLTELWAESDQTVTFMLQVDDGTPADIDTVDLAPAAGEAEDTSLDGDTTLGVDEELDLAVTSVANTPTWVSICWTFTKND